MTVAHRREFLKNNNSPDPWRMTAVVLTLGRIPPRPSVTPDTDT
jgi:hypothetical protein